LDTNHIILNVITKKAPGICARQHP
jgi:hypothetical protein